MCILCALQRGSRRAIGMLPWLVIPLVVVWAASQILPPGLRFEVTSPRLACVGVLLGTIFWYEILLPLVSVYRARRCARAREQQLSMAAEVHKLRKTATRRCRNCLAPYRDQNPCSGKFMCSSCGHLSKRPILDLNGHPGTRNPGFLSDFLGKNGWFLKLGCSNQHNGAWDEHWDDSFGQGRVSSLYSFTSAVFGRILEVGSSESKRGRALKVSESVVQESKWEKARRKAEEKRLAKLEKQMLEDEERRQREEVARLIEERRRLREVVKMEGDDKEEINGSKEGRREESDKRRRGRRKERELNCTKSSTSEGEDHELARLSSSCKSRSSLTVVPGQKSKLFDGGKGASYSPTSFSKGWNAFSKDSHAGLISVTKSSRPITGCMNKNQFTGKPSLNSDAEISKQNLTRVVATVPPPITTPGKSWRQLFARPSLRTFPMEDVWKSQINEADEKSSDTSTDAPSTDAPSTKVFFQEKEELFQDPCFEPDRDKGDYMPNSLPSIRKECISAKKPSPIESPMSRSCSSREDQSALLKRPSETDQGTWQMWSSSLCKDGLDLVGGPTSWLSALEQSRVGQEGMSHSPTDSSVKPCDNVYAGKLGDDGMVIQFMAEHHPHAGRVAVPLHPFPGDVRSHLAYLGFQGGVPRKAESCFRPNGYAHPL
ncbi:uncharacterized protein LOC144715489 [Wolffia australiana]